MTNEIANRLKNNSEKIMKLWSARAQRDIQAAVPLEKLALRDSLPEYLTQIVDALSNTIIRTPSRVADDKIDSTRVGFQHGTDRATLSNYSVDEVIFEFHILREIIFKVMEEDQPLPSKERDIIISSIEQAVNDSATQFAAVLKDIQQKIMVTLTHDLRTPIAIAKLSGDLILRRSEEKDSQELAKRVVDAMGRVDEMIDDLLDSSRVRAGQKMQLEFQEMDLAKLMREICHELKIIFGDRITFNATGEIKGYWSEQGLRRLIENLISNAVKYGYSNSVITASVTEVIQGTKLEVHNLGKPIKKDDIPTLFDQFKRGPDTGKKQGWGIGLTLVKGITDAHQGRINVESSQEKGTSFIILLPNDFRKATFGDAKVDFHQPLQL